MRKTVIAAAILFPAAFMFGVAFQKLYLRSLARYVSPCTVTEHRTVYRALRGTDLVNVRGFLYGGDALYLADKDLNRCGGSLVGVEIPEGGKISLESEALIGKLRRLGGQGRVARAEFEVVGTLAEDGRGRFATRHVIRVEQILPAGPPEVVAASDFVNKLEGAR